MAGGLSPKVLVTFSSDGAVYGAGGAGGAGGGGMVTLSSFTSDGSGGGGVFPADGGGVIPWNGEQLSVVQHLESVEALLKNGLFIPSFKEQEKQMVENPFSRKPRKKQEFLF